MKKKYITKEQRKKLSESAGKTFDAMVLCLLWGGCDTHTANLKLVLTSMRRDNLGPLFAVQKLLESGELKRDEVD